MVSWTCQGHGFHGHGKDMRVCEHVKVIGLMDMLRSWGSWTCQGHIVS